VALGGSPVWGDDAHVLPEDARPVPASYEIRVKGRVTDALMPHLEGLSARVDPVETVLYGKVEDQAALYGLLDRLGSLGLELVEVRRFGGESS
jgi:hypothetical protein